MSRNPMYGRCLDCGCRLLDAITKQPIFDGLSAENNAEHTFPEQCHNCSAFQLTEPAEEATA